MLCVPDTVGEISICRQRQAEEEKGKEGENVHGKVAPLTLLRSHLSGVVHRVGVRPGNEGRPQHLEWGRNEERQSNSHQAVDVTRRAAYQGVGGSGGVML